MYCSWLYLLFRVCSVAVVAYLHGSCILLSNCCLLVTEPCLLIGKINDVLILELWGIHKLIFRCLFPSASLQVTTYLVSKAHLLCHQPHPRTSSIHPSRPWAAAHWPIRGAPAHRPQPAWRPTCRVRRNASSCRTAGSWAAMWPWRAGKWPTITYTRAGKFKYRCTKWCDTKSEETRLCLFSFTFKVCPKTYITSAFYTFYIW